MIIIRPKDLTMLIGPPCSGKSTYIVEMFNKNPVKIIKSSIASTDIYIQKFADKNNMTYNQAFDQYYKHAEKEMNAGLAQAVAEGFDIIWDQTNLTKKARRRKLARIPSHYRKVAVVFYTPFDILLERNENRVIIGKNMPPSLLKKMVESFEEVDESEGFDEIIRIRAIDSN